MAELDLDAVKARVDKAHAHIGDLCTGRSRWKMTIPVNPERDSDLILTEALVDADRLMAEVKQLREQRDKVLARCDEADDTTCPNVGNHDPAIVEGSFYCWRCNGTGQVVASGAIWASFVRAIYADSTSNGDAS